MTAIAFSRSKQSTQHTPHGEALAALSDAGQWVLATFREWRRRSGDRERLAGLDDRMLRDIGLSRADAMYLSSKPFWKE